jgi:hypothetical protein
VTPRARGWVAVGAVWAICVIAYLPSLAVPFQFDDYARIAENIPLHQGRYLAALQWLGNARLLPGITLLFNYTVGGVDPFGYHLFNLGVHLLATLGVFALAGALCRAPRLRATAPARHPLATATAAALIFACHPLQTQAITYIIQRSASMAALFYVWSIVWYVRARNRQSGTEAGAVRSAFALAGLLAICAVLSKENSLTLPLAALFSEWAAFGRLPSRRLVLRGALLVVLLIALPVVWKLALQPVKHRSAMPLLARLTEAVLQRQLVVGPTLSPLGYLLTQAAVVPRYLLLAVRPWGLNVDHDVPAATGATPAVAAGALFLLVLLAAGLAAVPRWPMVGYGIVWVFITLAVESSILPIADVMMEHRMYLPMAGIALAAAAGFAAARERAPRAVAVLGAAVIAALVALTFARNTVWQSPLTLWLDAVEKSPRKARVHVNVGVAYHGVDRLDDAVRHYCRALRLDPDIALAADNLEIALDAQGKLDELEAKLVEPNANPQVRGAVVVEIDLDQACPK